MNPLRELAARVWRRLRHETPRALEAARWRCRRALAAAGLPASKPYLVLRCYDGPEGAGLFHEVRVALGALDHFERWRDTYAGIRVDYGTAGLFHDPAHGPNWWTYYFDPLVLGDPAPAAERVVDPVLRDIFADLAEYMPRARGAELLRRHVRVRPSIGGKVEAYVRERFGDAHVIGVNYRGTNKHEEAPRVPYGDVGAAVDEALAAAPPGPVRLFVATDEQAFLDYMLGAYGERVLYREMFRSRDGRPIDEFNEDGNHRKGEDAVIDCLLLARCRLLIRTESNLSVCATLFSPSLPYVALNRPYDWQSAPPAP